MSCPHQTDHYSSSLPPAPVSRCPPLLHPKAVIPSGVESTARALKRPDESGSRRHSGQHGRVSRGRHVSAGKTTAAAGNRWRVSTQPAQRRVVGERGVGTSRDGASVSRFVGEYISLRWVKFAVFAVFFRLLRPDRGAVKPLSLWRAAFRRKRACLSEYGVKYELICITRARNVEDFTKIPVKRRCSATSCSILFDCNIVAAGRSHATGVKGAATRVRLHTDATTTAPIQVVMGRNLRGTLDQARQKDRAWLRTARSASV